MAGIYLLSEFFQKTAERKSPKKYFFIFRFDGWPGIRTRALRLIIQHTTRYNTATITCLLLLGLL